MRVWRFLHTPQGQLRLAWFLTIAAIVLSIVLVGQHTLFRYLSYHADAFDLGNMDQAVWNTLHGHPFRFTNRGLDWFGPPTRLGIHVEPILLLIAPLYLIHSGPETLIVLQTVALALGGIPLFLLGLRRLPEMPLVAAAFVGAYLVAPELLGEALWDFHPVALATPLLLLALWALDGRRYGWFVVAAVLAAFTKEDVALALVPLGIFIAIWQSKPRLGSAVAILSAGWVALCFLVILPHFNGGVSGGNNYWYRYAWMGNNAGSAIANLLTHPWLPLLLVLDSTARLGYLTMLLRTGGGLGVFAPALWICGLPELAVNVLSMHAEQYSGFFQYNAVLLPFLMAAAVYGTATLYDAIKRRDAGEPAEVRKITARPGALGQAVRVRDAISRAGAQWAHWPQRLPLRSDRVALAIIMWLLLTSGWNLATADGRVGGFWQAGASLSPHRAATDALLAKVPATASVAATDTLNPHLSDRYDLYLMPDPQSYTAQYVAVDILHASQDRRAADQTMYDAMVASGHYVVAGTAGPVVLLRRVGAPISPPST